MMTDEKTSTNRRGLKKRLLGLLVGLAAGYAAAASATQFINSDMVGGLAKSASIAALVGVLYALIGLGVGLGAASPKFGARFLNVEDADELREQKKVLVLSGLGMTLLGLSLFALALAAPDGPLPQRAALALSGGGLALGTVLSIPAYRLSDELMRAVNVEGGALSFGLTVLIAGGWALFAHLGYAAAPAPLDLLTLFYAIMLFASFIATGRRGMLMLR
jgi:hypothetical protein